MRTQEVLYNVLGQSWFYDPPEGRPDASPVPTLTIVLNMSGDDVSILELATTGVCSLDAVNTTISAAVVAGANVLALTSAAGMVRGRRYLLSSVNGDREWIEPLTIAVSGAVTTRRPLQNAYPIGSTLVGTRISIGVDPTWVATRAKISEVLATTWKTAKESSSEWLAGYAGYRLRWGYSFGGSPTIGVSYGELVRYNSKSLVTALEVDDTFPGWIDRLPIDHQEDQGARLVSEAYHAVRFDAMGDGEVLRRIRNTEILRELTIYRANVLSMQAAVLSGSVAPALLAEAERLYDRRYNQLMREPKFQADQLGDGSATAARRLPAWRR